MWAQRYRHDCNYRHAQRRCGNGRGHSKQRRWRGQFDVVLVTIDRGDRDSIQVHRIIWCDDVVLQCAGLYGKLMSTDKDAAPEWGPKMQALHNDRQRNFVAALYDEEAPMKGDGLLIYAARKAGYGNKEGTTTNEAFGAIGGRLVQSERVHEAIA